jgi:hypothetical protein
VNRGSEGWQVFVLGKLAGVVTIAGFLIGFPLLPAP